MRRNFFGFLVFAGLMTGCTFNEPVVFRGLENLALAGADDEHLNLTAEAVFYNPNKVAGKLRDVYIEVWLQEQRLAVISQEEKTTVPASDTFQVPLQARIAARALQQNFWNHVLTLAQGNKLNLHFKGYISISKAAGLYRQQVAIDHTAAVRL